MALTCWRCGAQMEDTQPKCYACGAERPRARRSQARANAEQKAAEGSSRRRASARPEAPPPPERKAGSMPPGKGRPQQRNQRAPEDVRMIKRHEYQAIIPETQGYDHVNWLRMCIIAVSCVLVLVVGVYLFLRMTTPGQRILASNGRDASAEAYHELGRIYLAEGSPSKAVWAMEIAQQKNPDDLETLIDLGKAYTGHGDLASAEIAFSRAIQHWPAHPDPYRLLIENLGNEGRNDEALQLARIALSENGDSYFQNVYEHMIPDQPKVSKLGKKYETEIDVEITCQEGASIYYTLDNTDPTGEGILYTGPVHLEDGASWRLRAVAFKDGMYSEEQIQTYVINKPAPDMPKSSLAPDTYSTVRDVTLRPGGKDVVRIFYTIDGTMPGDSTGPSSNAKEFVEGDAITLRIGKTQLRAIAYNVEGKASNELVVNYVCEGRTAATMSEKDTVAGLKLNGTTRAAFEKTYGAPTQEVSDGEDELGTYQKLIYPFGYAVFLTRGDRDPVLMELSTNSTAFSGPRGTGIGSRMEDIISAFRDNGGEANAQGNRNLYIMTDGRLAQLTKTGENNYEISYYHPLENKRFISLTYYIENGLVTKMEWVQYPVASPV